MSIADMIGMKLPEQTVVVERGPASFFARAVTDDSPVFHRPDAAAEAGFDAIPTVPTYAFAMHHMGAFPELQPDNPPDNPLMTAIGRLMEDGGLILHGEQEFRYRRPVQVGDRLVGRGRIADVSTKESNGGRMTFVVAETDWADESGQPVVTSRMTLIHRR